jgi:hypothetical protein
MLSNLFADIRYSLRGFARRPAFAAVVVATLALGIGVNVMIFSLFEQVLSRPLPVSEAERLANLSSPGGTQGNTSCNHAGNCDAVFVDRDARLGRGRRRVSARAPRITDRSRNRFALRMSMGQRPSGVRARGQSKGSDPHGCGRLSL